MRAVALRAYEDTPYGMTDNRVWTDGSFPNSIALSTPSVTRRHRRDHRTNSVPSTGGRVDDVRVITHGTGGAASCRRKKPDVMETRVGGGSVDDRVISPSDDRERRRTS